MDPLDALPEDFRDLLADFADAEADFMLIEGWAMAVHGRPRATEDLDVWVRATRQNSSRVYKALLAFGAPLKQHRVHSQTFASDGTAYRFGRKPNLAEVLTQISGVTFAEAIDGVLHVSLGGRDIRVIGADALLANKLAAGRPKDLDDAAWLRAKK